MIVSFFFLVSRISAVVHMYNVGLYVRHIIIQKNINSGK